MWLSGPFLLPLIRLKKGNRKYDTIHIKIGKQCASKSTIPAIYSAVNLLFALFREY